MSLADPRRCVAHLTRDRGAPLQAAASFAHRARLVHQEYRRTECEGVRQGATLAARALYYFPISVSLKREGEVESICFVIVISLTPPDTKSSSASVSSRACGAF